MKKGFLKTLKPYFYLTPTFLILGIILIYPIIKVFIDSFYRFFGDKRIPVGLGNYKFLFLEDNTIYKSIFNNLKMLTVVPILLILALVISFVMFNQIKNYKIYQFIFFLPVILSVAVVGVVFRYLLRSDGLINTIFQSLHLNFLSQNWLGNPKISIFALIGVIVWKELGFGIVLFMARLLSLDKSLFEAARIDGANSFTILFRVVIPQIKSLMAFYVLYNVIIVFSWTFGYVYTMTKGGPSLSTITLEYQIYHGLTTKNLPGIASAVAVVLFVIVFVFIFLQSKVRMADE